MSKRGENIYKRKDGRWEGRYIKARTAAGKAIYGYVYAPSYKETRAKLQNAAGAYPDRRTAENSATDTFLYAYGGMVLLYQTPDQGIYLSEIPESLEFLYLSGTWRNVFPRTYARGVAGLLRDASDFRRKERQRLVCENGLRHIIPDPQYLPILCRQKIPAAL